VCVCVCVCVCVIPAAYVVYDVIPAAYVVLQSPSYALIQASNVVHRPFMHLDDESGQSCHLPLHAFILVFVHSCILCYFLSVIDNQQCWSICVIDDRMRVTKNA